MASRLAAALAATPYGPNAVGDVIWRNTDLATVDWIGVCPTDELFDELLMVAGAGEAGVSLGRLVPTRRLLEAALGSGSVTVRRGAAANPHTTDADLAVLAADRTAAVAKAATEEQAERARLRAEIANGARDALVTVVRSNRLELLTEILDQDPGAVASISPGDQGELLTRLGALDPALRDRFAVTVLSTDAALLTAATVTWALADPVGETLLATIDTQRLRRRATDVAVQILTANGLLPRPKEPARPRSASIDGMALVLTPGELGAMFFSSDTPVSSTTEALIFDQCPVQMLTPYLLGSTLRRPTPEKVRRIIMGSSASRRNELCAALGVAMKEPEKALALPWAGELALGLTATGLKGLDLQIAAQLLATLDGMLAGRVEAWEFLLILSEEWEQTLADLAIAAGVIEDVHA